MFVNMDAYEDSDDDFCDDIVWKFCLLCSFVFFVVYVYDDFVQVMFVSEFMILF